MEHVAEVVKIAHSSTASELAGDVMSIVKDAKSHHLKDMAHKIIEIVSKIVPKIKTFVYKRRHGGQAPPVQSVLSAEEVEAKINGALSVASSVASAVSSVAPADSSLSSVASKVDALADAVADISVSHAPVPGSRDLAGLSNNGAILISVMSKLLSLYSMVRDVDGELDSEFESVVSEALVEHTFEREVDESSISFDEAVKQVSAVLGGHEEVVADLLDSLVVELKED